MTNGNAANMSGMGAITIWFFVPLTLALIGDMPPFLLGAFANLVAFSIVCLWWLYKGESLPGKFRMMPKAYLMGIFGFTLYNTLFVYAMKTGPLLEVSLLNFTWPAFLIIFSVLVQKMKPDGYALAGIALCFTGAVFVFASRGALTFSAGHITLLMGLLCGLIWGVYSTLLKRIPIRSDQVAVFFLTTGVTMLTLHLLFEPTVWPSTALRWSLLLVFAFSRMAYMMWNYAMKHGSARVVGSLSYFIPLVSTSLLAAAGFARYSPYLALGAGLIITGCLTINFKAIAGNASLAFRRIRA